MKVCDQDLDTAQQCSSETHTVGAISHNSTGAILPCYQKSLPFRLY